jgi:hypothetical protein
VDFKSVIKAKFSAFHCLNNHVPGGVFKLSGHAAFGLLCVGLLTYLLLALAVRSNVNRASVSSGYASACTLCLISTGTSTVLRMYVVFLNPHIKNWTATIQCMKLKRVGKIIHMHLTPINFCYRLFEQCHTSL